METFHRCDEFFLVHSAALGDLLAPNPDLNPIAECKLFRFVADENDDETLAATALDDLQDRCLGCDVDAGGGVQENEHGWVWAQRRAQEHLLLIAAAELADALRDRSTGNPEIGAVGFGELTTCLAGDQEALRERLEVREGDVVLDGQ